MRRRPPASPPPQRLGSGRCEAPGTRAEAGGARAPRRCVTDLHRRPRSPRPASRRRRHGARARRPRPAGQPAPGCRTSGYSSARPPRRRTTGPPAAARPGRRPRTQRPLRARRRTRRRRAVSRCEPAAHHGGSASGTAHRLPAGSRSTASPVSAACSANHSPAAASSGVHASRVVPRSPRPIGRRPARRRSRSTAEINRAPARPNPGARRQARLPRRRTRPGCARSGTARGRPARRATRDPPACRVRGSRARRSSAAPRPR